MPAATRFASYSREMEIAVEARLKMEKAIADALQLGWFELLFQPQYDLSTRRLTGFEALVRMNHPERGELLPADFLPIADESGLIQPLGEWTIRNSLATAAEWPPHLALSINISPAQFRHGDVANAIVNAASQAGFSCHRLRIELSEAVLLADSNIVSDQLRRLKGRGVTLVLDDFGVERSRLRSLSGSPIDAVKLDRSLIERVGAEPEADKLAASLINAARSFDLDVLAEGIERAEQAHFLMSNHCHKVQGFLFGRPAPDSDLAAIIAKDLRKAMDSHSVRNQSETAAA